VIGDFCDDGFGRFAGEEVPFSGASSGSAYGRFGGGNFVRRLVW
jgi:hypothetical protein